ncbi:hypothetical protein HY061_02950 [Candidatus Azambacteria bacterium]|nr:hypothetical protein [Candidatus Azambacteria bacterium]
MSKEKIYASLGEAFKDGQIVTLTSAGNVVVTPKKEIREIPVRGRREVK